MQASIDLGDEAHGLDTGNRADLVIVGGISGDTDRTKQRPGGIADQHAAGNGDDLATRDGGQAFNEVRALLRVLVQPAWPMPTASEP